MQSGTNRSSRWRASAPSGRRSAHRARLRDRRHRHQGRLPRSAAASRSPSRPAALGACLKWAPMTAQTKLVKIHVRVGRTGALNPWARLEPVEVGGVTVSQATLHNEEDINRKDIREGDTVIVQRAGDVIPQVVGPVLPHAKGTKRFRMPKRCPLCGTDIVKPEGEVMHRCPNNDCPRGPGDAQQLGYGCGRHRRGRRAVRSAPLGPWPSPLHPRSLPLTAEQLAELDGYAEIRLATPSMRSPPPRTSPSLAFWRVSTSPTWAGSPRRTSRGISGRSTACSLRGRRTSRRSTGSA